MTNKMRCQGEAIALNLIFRIGISQKANLLLSPQLDAGAEVYRFMEN